MQKLRGQLVIEGQTAELAGSTVIVRLEEVGRADTTSVTLSEYRIEALGPQAASGRVPFELDWKDPGKGTCSVRAHVDVDRDGRVGRGDYVSTEANVVASPDTFVVVRVRKV